MDIDGFDSIGNSDQVNESLNNNDLVTSDEQTLQQYEGDYVCLGSDDSSLQYLDLDGDGYIDSVAVDTTGNGSLDTVYIDTNGDELIDTIEHDGNDDGIADVIGYDTTGDGQIDDIYIDTDGDGLVDTLESIDDWDSFFNLFGEFEITVTPEDLSYESAFNGYISEVKDNQVNGHDIDQNGDITYMEVETNSSHVGRESYFEEGYGIIPPQFDVDSGNEGVVGEPAEDMSYWHEQTHPDTCAVVSQEFILEDLLGHDFDENDLMNVALEHGWYTPGGGTTLDDVGNILEYYGLEVERGSGSIDSLESALEHGDKIIVAVDSNEIWSNGYDSMSDQLYSVLGIPDTDANHAVEVIGVDRSDPDHPMIILNDPGHKGGQGSMIPLELFQQAWSDSGNFMVEASV